MTAITRTRVTATPLYPGSFVSEHGTPVEIPDVAVSTALAAVPDDGRWFALEVVASTQRRYEDGDGNVRWITEGTRTKFRILVGEMFTSSQIEQWPDADRYRILLSNMRGNGWDPIVRTRLGNFQPAEGDDVVVRTP